MQERLRRKDEILEYNINAKIGIDPAIKAKYDQADNKARLLLRNLSETSQERLNEAAIKSCITEVTRIKYFLDRENMTSEYFNALGELSVAKRLGIDVSQVKGIDLEAKCNNTSSVMTKKILLVIFIGKELGIQIDADRASNAITISELSRLVYEQLEKRMS